MYWDLQAGGRHGQRLREEGMEMFWFGPHLGGWSWALGSLVFWALVVVAIIALVRSFTRTGQGPNPPQQGYASGMGSYGQSPPAPGQAASPEHILAVRFARSEIDEDEFHQRMAALRVQAWHPGLAANS